MVDMELSGDKCDFCNVRGENKWTYKVRPFTIMLILSEHGQEEHVSGDWAACDTCHRLVEAGAWKTLARHSLDIQGVEDAMREVIAAYLEVLWYKFRENRLGGAEGLSP